jgi:hypothetical protein
VANLENLATEVWLNLPALRAAYTTADCWLLLPSHAGSSLADFSTLRMEAIRSSETSVHFTRSTRRHIPEDGILHSLIFVSSQIKYYYYCCCCCCSGDRLPLLSFFVVFLSSS